VRLVGYLKKKPLHWAGLETIKFMTSLVPMRNAVRWKTSSDEKC